MGDLTQDGHEVSDANNMYVLQTMGVCCNQWANIKLALGGVFYLPILNELCIALYRPFSQA